LTPHSTSETQIEEYKLLKAEGYVSELLELHEYFSHNPLNSHNIHVWSIKMEEKTSDKFLHLLSERERDKASSYLYEKDRRRYTTSRGILRQTISYYTGQRPENIQFIHEENEKPRINEKHRLYFNLSHSYETTIFGFSSTRQVGVDIEHIRLLKYVDDMATRMFNLKNLKKFKQLSNKEKNKLYLKSWTIKEAYYKATGKNLTLDNMEIKKGEPILSVKEKISIHSFNTWKDYIASIIIS
jgi:4'-phosphopantetheinyl transferase